MALLADDLYAWNVLKFWDVLLTSSQLNLQQLALIESTDLVIRAYSRDGKLCSERPSMRFDISFTFGAWRLSRMPLGKRRFALKS